MPLDQYLLVVTTFPDTDIARQIGTELVERQLAACVNLLPQGESIYRWEGKIERQSEVMALIKTTETNYPEIEMRIGELHPYEVPEVVALKIDRGAHPYLAWISESTIG